MSVNSSSNSSLNLLLYNCFTFKTSFYVYIALFVTNIFLLLPLIILVLYVGYKRWRKQRSVATAAVMSHSDIFTFNMIVVELIGVLGTCCHSYGGYTNQQSLILVGMCFVSIMSSGQTLFHLLTCVERYLAVVHPITYLGLRQTGGVRIRNISIGFVWLICFGSLAFSLLNINFNIIYSFLLLGFSLIVVSYCSLSVLCVLIRPGPGEEGGKRERVDQSKLRAFHTIMAIMGVLLLKFSSNLISIAIVSSSVLSLNESCLLGISVGWLSLPSSLVLPLLFLQRAGKLPGCQHKTVSS